MIKIRFCQEQFRQFSMFSIYKSIFNFGSSRASSTLFCNSSSSAAVGGAGRTRGAGGIGPSAGSNAGLSGE